VWYPRGLSPFRWFLAGLFALALAVRLYFAQTLSLNPDECLHINAGSSAQWSVYHHPPLLFCWLWAATLVSNQEWWLRLAPVLAGALTPLACGFWLQRWTNRSTAWGVAAVLAFMPNLVLLSVQLRGYSMALMGIAAALYALERAFAESSRRWLLLHFLALSVGILAEFMTAWIAMAMGLYGMVRLVREPALRRLAPGWIAGQAAGVGTYAALYWFIVRPVVARHDAQYLIQTYLRGAFPQAGENPLQFAAVGAFKQLVYIAGSAPAGALAAAFLALAVAYWLWARDSRAVLILALGLAVGGALAQFYPFGRTRHTVAIGMVALGAVAAGIELASARWRPLRWAGPAALFALTFFFPMPDIHNPGLLGWQKSRWDDAMAELLRRVPPGATVLADEEALQMLQANLAPRHDRFRLDGEPNTMVVHGLTIKSVRWDWSMVKPEWVTAEARLAKGSVWLVDAGFTVAWARTRSLELGAQTVIDSPGVLYLSRLRP
jgi:4-amino-4-deoxy-L-arabinose transferase-like glycosyltransferase